MQTFTGIEYLKIDIASNYGLDKEDWDARIAWTDTYNAVLENMAGQAEEPGLFTAGVLALRRAQKGLPSGYPISLDAASSGLQLLACLTGCEDSAKLCGVVSTGHREDAYTRIYERMCAKIGDATKIARKDTKQAIMTSLYASTAVPKQVFGEGELLVTFYETMETSAPGAWALNQALQQLWQPMALSHDWVLPDNFHAHIKVMTPVTHYVQALNQPVAVTINENLGTKEGKSISPNLIHSIDGMVVREMHRRCSFNSDKLQTLMTEILLQRKHRFPWGTSTGREMDGVVSRLWDLYQMSGFLSTRILDYLDRDNMGLVDATKIEEMIGTLPSKPFDLVSVHDCFRCLPNYGNDLRRQYNLILSQIAGSKILEFLASQVLGYHLPVTKRGDISSQILHADYALS